VAKVTRERLASAKALGYANGKRRAWRDMATGGLLAIAIAIVAIMALNGADKALQHVGGRALAQPAKVASIATTSTTSKPAAWRAFDGATRCTSDAPHATVACDNGYRGPMPR
jgi:hypothetical protein